MQSSLAERAALPGPFVQHQARKVELLRPGGRIGTGNGGGSCSHGLLLGFAGSHEVIHRLHGGEKGEVREVQQMK